MNPWFEIAASTFDPKVRRTEVVAASAAAASTALRVPDDFFCFVHVSLQDKQVSYGELLLWCAGDRSFARILEHRGYTAREHGDIIGGNDVTFRDEDGAPFTISRAETVPRDLAISALQSWIMDRKHPALLHWSEE